MIKKNKLYKKSLIIISIVLIIFFNIPLCHAYNEINYEESTQTINNTERGFYRLLQVKLYQKENIKVDITRYIEEAKKENISLISLQINLEDFVAKDTNLSSDNIAAINNCFDKIRRNGMKCIFRVVYDNKGTKNPEPEFATILNHIEQLKNVYQENEDIIYVIEAGFLGSYGEWHDGKYDTKEQRNKILKKLLEVTSKNTMINVRKKEFYTELFGDESINSQNAYSKEDMSRVGIHNDGYLASETDYGSYLKNERESELEWQHTHTMYTIFGGEAVKAESSYNDFENAIQDMYYRHCQYLNQTYDVNVKEKWKNSIYNNRESSYNGINGYKFIEDHLGYRFVLKNSGINKEQNDDYITVNLSVENTGFSNLTQEKNVEIILKNEKEIYKAKIDVDVRKILSNEIYQKEIILNLPNEMEIGDFEVYIRISDNSEKLYQDNSYCIKFANENIYNENLGANYIGKFRNNKIVKNSNKILQQKDNIGNNTTMNTKNTWISITIIVCIIVITIIGLMLIRKI